MTCATPTSTPTTCHYGNITLRPPAVVNTSTATPDYDFLTRRQHHTVTIRHPAYPARDSELFTIPALDHAQGGIHHGLLLSICAIVADNKDGFLSLDTAGAPIDAAFDQVLRAQDYYYFVPHPDDDAATSSSPYKWPVVTAFADWEYPHRLPASWLKSLPADRITPPEHVSQSNFSQAVKVRDASCRVSQHRTAAEVAHICPETEKDWFIENNMQKYKDIHNSSIEYLLKDPANTLLLRSDIHKAFDSKSFALFPKGNDGSLAVHVFEQDMDLCQIYHNVILHPIPGCSREFLFARFAWTIFPFLAPAFLSRAVPRYIITVDHQTGERSAKVTSDTQELSSKSTSSRSRSTKKRSRVVEIGDGDMREDEGLACEKRRRCHRSSLQSTTISEVVTPSFLPGSSPEELRQEQLRQEALQYQRTTNRDIIRRHEEQRKQGGWKESFFENLEDNGFETLDDNNMSLLHVQPDEPLGG